MPRSSPISSFVPGQNCHPWPQYLVLIWRLIGTSTMPSHLYHFLNTSSTELCCCCCCCCWNSQIARTESTSKTGPFPLSDMGNGTTAMYHCSVFWCSFNIRMKEIIESVLEGKEEEKKDTNSQNKHASQRVDPMKMKTREKLILAPRTPKE